MLRAALLFATIIATHASHKQPIDSNYQDLVREFKKGSVKLVDTPSYDALKRHVKKHGIKSIPSELRARVIEELEHTHHLRRQDGPTEQHALRVDDLDN